MAVPPDFLALLRCPATGQTLAIADAELLSKANSLQNNRGSESSHPGAATGNAMLEAALVRLDRKILFPIRQGIPVLLMEEAIVL